MLSCWFPSLSHRSLSTVLNRRPISKKLGLKTILLFSLRSTSQNPIQLTDQTTKKTGGIRPREDKKSGFLLSRFQSDASCCFFTFFCRTAAKVPRGSMRTLRYRVQECVMIKLIGANFTRNQRLFHGYSISPALSERFLYGSNWDPTPGDGVPWGY